MTDTDTEWWTADQCAAHLDIQRDSWLRMVRAGQLPAHDHYHPHTGQRLWSAAAVRAHQRPGRGARTDLRRARQD